MAKRNKQKRTLADLSRLEPLDEDAKNIIQVIIATPKGSRNNHQLKGKKHRILDVKGPAEAQWRVQDGMKAVRK